MVGIGFLAALVLAVATLLELLSAATRTGIVAANAFSPPHDGQWGRLGFQVFLLEILVVLVVEAIVLVVEAIALVVEVIVLLVKVIIFLVVGEGMLLIPGLWTSSCPTSLRFFGKRSITKNWPGKPFGSCRPSSRRPPGRRAGKRSWGDDHAPKWPGNSASPRTRSISPNAECCDGYEKI